MTIAAPLEMGPRCGRWAQGEMVPSPTMEATRLRTQIEGLSPCSRSSRTAATLQRQRPAPRHLWTNSNYAFVLEHRFPGTLCAVAVAGSGRKALPLDSIAPRKASFSTHYRHPHPLYTLLLPQIRGEPPWIWRRKASRDFIKVLQRHGRNLGHNPGAAGASTIIPTNVDARNTITAGDVIRLDGVSGDVRTVIEITSTEIRIDRPTVKSLSYSATRSR